MPPIFFNFRRSLFTFSLRWRCDPSIRRRGWMEQHNNCPRLFSCCCWREIGLCHQQKNRGKSSLSSFLEVGKILWDVKSPSIEEGPTPSQKVMLNGGERREERSLEDKGIPGRMHFYWENLCLLTGFSGYKIA